MTHPEKRWWFAIIIAITVTAIWVVSPERPIAVPVLAREISYLVLKDGRRVPSPVGYVFERELGRNIGLSRAEDLFITPQGNLFIADAGNDRIVEIDPEGHLIFQISGPEAGLFSPEGVYVTEDRRIFVADTGNSRIVEFDSEGRLVREYPKPSSPLLERGPDYKPSKVVVDKRGYIYVVNFDDYRGILQLDLGGRFRGFFAPDRVAFSLRRIFIKTLATKSQQERILKSIPAPHSNVFLASTGHLYSVTRYAPTNQIKKLSPVGIDVYNGTSRNFYGEKFREGWALSLPSFADSTVDSYGIISVLDTFSGRVYQYDQDKNMIGVFGGRGEGRGLFGSPTSIVSDKSDNLYILDRDRNNIQVFRPTYFTSLVHQASRLYSEGRYQDAAIVAKKLTRLSANFMPAYGMIGKALYREGRWAEALDQFRIAGDRDGYSRALSELRRDYMRKHFGPVVLYVALIFGFLTALVRVVRYLLSQPGDRDGPFRRLLRAVCGVIVSPVDTFARLKFEGTVWQALVVMAAVLAVRIFSLGFAGFAVYHGDPDEVSLFREVVWIGIAWLLWTAVNCGVTRIADGEGTFRQILVGTAYCLVPYMLVTPAFTLISNLAVSSEIGLFTLGTWGIAIWSTVLILGMLRTIHVFGNGRTIGIALVSIFGMVVSIGAVALVFGLVNQAVSFVGDVVMELAIR